MANKHATVDSKQSLNFLARRSSRERREPPPANFCATVALSCEGKERGCGEGMNGRGGGGGDNLSWHWGGVTYWDWHSFRFKALLRIKAKNSPERNTKNFSHYRFLSFIRVYFFQVSWPHRGITNLQTNDRSQYCLMRKELMFLKLLMSVPANNTTPLDRLED